MLLKLFVVLLVSNGIASWKLCEDTFCNTLRKSPDGIEHRYYVDGEFTNEANVASATMKTDAPTDAVQLKLSIKVYEDEVVRIQIDENTNSKRYRADIALIVKDEKLTKLDVKKNDTGSVITTKNFKIEVLKKPFTIKVYNKDRLITEINPEDRFVFETKAGKNIALGVTLVDVQRAFGLPEHAERLALKSTKKNGEPYRHFNLDYGRYQLETREALYGSIGVLYGHGTNHSSGVFWLNPSQTWIDLENSPNKVNAFFMSESGIVDLFVLPGPTLPDAAKQFTKVTGTAPLPQYFTLGYHQSRYSYMSQDIVLDVVKNFDATDLPVDVLWLDIDYTDGKKYFTWDPTRFSNPKKLITDLASKNRKLVAIIDPHIKVEKGYFLHDEATAKGYYVKTKDNADYVGDCWPGKSSYLDFLNKEASDYYALQYSKNNFENPNVHVWNDMNEPAVFNVPDDENTMPLDAKHSGGFEHRDVHNIYGFYQTVGTNKGLLDAKSNSRPFILTRSHFAGIQRYAAIWTGDNGATWEYLRISYPMCLTEALAGVSFCGADVGGFFDIPDDELYTRWYQAGAWLPFYRGHSAIDVPRREPYLFNDIVQKRVKKALYQRYAHLPVWYTLFYEHEMTGEPVIRPITYHYPLEGDALSIDNQILLGTDILAAPVLVQGALETRVYLPGGEKQIWFNIDDNFKQFRGTGYQMLNVSLDSTPVFYRAGSVISRKNTRRPTSVDTYKDGFTLYICLDEDGIAEGTLYVDDYETFKYRSKEFVYLHFSFNSSFLDLHHMANNTFKPAANISEIVIVNSKLTFVSASLIKEEEQSTIEAAFSEEPNAIVMSNFTVALDKPFTIEFAYGESSSATIRLSIVPLILLIVTIIYNH